MLADTGKLLISGLSAHLRGFSRIKSSGSPFGLFLAADVLRQDRDGGISGEGI